MRALLLLLLYFGIVLALGAGGSYPVYYLLTQVFAVTGLAFGELVQDMLKGAAIIALWPLMHMLGLGSRADWGYAGTQRLFLKQLIIGLVLGVGSLLLVALLLVALDVRSFALPVSASLRDLLGTLVGILGSALLIAGLEETWFRGGLYTATASVSSRLRAIGITALLFAAVHFVKVELPIPPEDLDWWSGYVAIGHAFRQFGDAFLIDPFLALVAAGGFLGLLRLRTNSIASCIGVHAGWILVIKVLHKWGDRNLSSAWGFLGGDYDGVIGYLAFAWFSVLCLVYLRAWRFPRRVFRIESMGSAVARLSKQSGETKHRG